MLRYAEISLTHCAVRVVGARSLNVTQLKQAPAPSSDSSQELANQDKGLQCNPSAIFS